MPTKLKMLLGQGAGSEILRVVRLGARLFRVLSRRAPYARTLEVHQGGLPPEMTGKGPKPG